MFDPVGQNWFQMDIDKVHNRVNIYMVSLLAKRK